MSRRWSLWLLAIHSCIAVLLISIEEVHYWREYEVLQSIEDRQHEPYSFVLSPEVQKAMEVDRWLNDRERTVHALNMPVSLVVGWYSHPIGLYTNSLLGPSLLRMSRHLAVKSRVVVLDAVLVAGIGLQWWLIGLWIERRAPLARVLRAMAGSMTVLGIVMTLVTVIEWLAGHALQDSFIAVPLGLTILFSFLLVVLGWVLIVAVAIVGLVVLVTKTVRHRMSVTEATG